MNKKTIIQAIISMIFFGITIYVMYGFFNSDEQANSIDGANQGAKKNDINKFLNRSFKTWQSDIFENDSFRNLKDSSVKIPQVKQTDIGKENPFETLE